MNKKTLLSLAGLATLGIAYYYYSNSEEKITEDDWEDVEEQLVDQLENKAMDPKYRMIIKEIVVKLYHHLQKYKNDYQRSYHQVRENPQQAKQLKDTISESLAHFVTRLEELLLKDYNLNKTTWDNLIKNDIFFTEKQELIMTWVETILDKEPSISKIEDYIPEYVDKTLFLEFLKEVKHEHLKRMYFDLRFWRLYDPKEDLLLRSKTIAKTINDNGVYWNENVWKLILEKKGIKYSKYDLQALSKLNPEMNTYFAGQLTEDLKKYNTEFNQLSKHLFTDVMKPIAEVGEKYNPNVMELKNYDEAKHECITKDVFNFEAFSLHGFYISSNRYEELKMELRKESDNSWIGTSELLNSSYTVMAQMRGDTLLIKQKNIKVEGLTYTLRGSIKQGWYVGTWVDDIEKSDYFCAVVKNVVQLE